MNNWVSTQVAPLNVPPPLQGGKIISYFLFTRHGARAPLFNWSDYPVDQLKWEYGDTYKNKSIIRRIPVVNGSEYDFLKVSEQGRLLEAGVKQQENLGKLYYNYLSVQNNLLPRSNNYDLSKIYIRSSIVPRAIESAVSFLQGMYKPKSSTEKLFIQTGEPGNEILCPNSDSNDFFREQGELFMKSVKFQRRLSLIPQEIKNVIPKNRIDQILAGDFLYCLQFNGCKLPKIIEDDNERYRMMIHSKAKCFGSLYYLLNSNMSLATTGFIEFLGEKAFRPIIELFVSHLKKFMNNETKVKFTLFSGHDITISAFLLGLGIVNRDGIPPYASHLAAELWEMHGKRVLRFAVNGEVLCLNNSETIEVDDFLKKYVE